jgi:hypothetical protein
LKRDFATILSLSRTAQHRAESLGDGQASSTNIEYQLEFVAQSFFNPSPLNRYANPWKSFQASQFKGAVQPRTNFAEHYPNEPGA